MSYKFNTPYIMLLLDISDSVDIINNIFIMQLIFPDIRDVTNLHTIPHADIFAIKPTDLNLSFVEEYVILNVNALFQN